MNSLQNGFSILIPSWNNLPFLRICIENIREHSKLNHEIIVFVNEGKDGTIAFLKGTGIKHLVSDKNEGVCLALNRAAQVAEREWLVYLNDDMYVLPGWDTGLCEAAEKSGTQRMILSATMIEPVDSGNKCVIVGDFGKTPESFLQGRLLNDFMSEEKKDWNGSSWPPILVHRELWNSVGGYSEEFSPGMSSDPDFSMKLWKAGVRHFQGVGKSRVYHFQAKSTGRIKKNDGRRQFLEKWGITQSVFYKYYLRMGTAFNGPLAEPQKGPGYFFGWMRSKLKRFFTSFVPEKS